MIPREPVRVLLFNNHASVRRGLQLALDANPEIHVVGLAATTEAAVAETKRLRPDVVVLDERPAETSGIEACRAIRDASPTSRVLMLVSRGGNAALTKTLLAGAAGYVLRDLDTRTIEEAILVVGRGGVLFDAHLGELTLCRLRHLQRDDLRDGSSVSRAVTDQVLSLIAEGLNDQQIAERLAVPVATVQRAISSLAAAVHRQR